MCQFSPKSVGQSQSQRQTLSLFRRVFIIIKSRSVNKEINSRANHTFACRPAVLMENSITYLPQSMRCCLSRKLAFQLIGTIFVANVSRLCELSHHILITVALQIAVTPRIRFYFSFKNSGGVKERNSSNKIIITAANIVNTFQLLTVHNLIVYSPRPLIARIVKLKTNRKLRN